MFRISCFGFRDLGSSSIFPRQDDFARIAGAHRVEALLELVKGLFPRWGRREELETAHDVATFLLTGMNLSHMRSRKKLRSKRVLASLAGTVEGLYRRARGVDPQPAE